MRRLSVFVLLGLLTLVVSVKLGNDERGGTPLTTPEATRKIGVLVLDFGVAVLERSCILVTDGFGNNEVAYLVGRGHLQEVSVSEDSMVCLDLEMEGKRTCAIIRKSTQSVIFRMVKNGTAVEIQDKKIPALPPDFRERAKPLTPGVPVIK